MPVVLRAAKVTAVTPAPLDFNIASSDVDTSSRFIARIDPSCRPRQRHRARSQGTQSESDPLRVCTLNIRHGGGRRVEQLLADINAIDADTIVLTEFRNNRAGIEIRNGLTTTGLEHQSTFDTDPRTNTVLIASRAKPEGTDDQRDHHDWSHHRHLVIEYEWGNLVAVYLPHGRAKIPAWDSLLSTATRLAGTPTILIGDFNTGTHRIDEAGTTFIAPEYMDRLENVGYTDAWRHKNPDRRGATWHSTRNEFRLDYAFLSRSISGRNWDVRHDDRTRTKGTSDHTAVVLDIALAP